MKHDPVKSKGGFVSASGIGAAAAQSKDWSRTGEARGLGASSACAMSASVVSGEVGVNA